ncbi:hypothetical protein KHC28_03815 [Ancylobacter sonchi]|uniref:Ivy family c-type lysozyme inhibitor n=1 Tax=Ancylobacter sonchi TaxID=1937790 RepID=UPI001BD4ECFB|nr:Ivy family c-type lysozyme inhibitor [Ancylobacter sonchi]MBS7532778.1 hypothetical protein [Ancylobacter sonchi]
MKTARLAAMVLALASTVAPARAQTAAPARPHLYELIAHEPYRSTWNRLIAPVLKNDRWLKGARGVWVPMAPVSLNGVHVNIYVLCKPASCAQGKISAIFEADGRRAYAAFHTPAGTQILGTPPIAEHRALLTALH